MRFLQWVNYFWGNDFGDSNNCLSNKLKTPFKRKLSTEDGFCLPSLQDKLIIIKAHLA